MKRSSFHNEDSLLIFGSLEDLVHLAGKLVRKISVDTGDFN